jgi:hypothetical protein
MQEEYDPGLTLGEVNYYENGSISFGEDFSVILIPYKLVERVNIEQLIKQINSDFFGDDNNSSRSWDHTFSSL